MSRKSKDLSHKSKQTESVRSRRQKFTRATTIVLSATLSIVISPAVVAKLRSSDSPVERMQIVRTAIKEGDIQRKDGSSLKPLGAEKAHKIILAQPWGDWVWNKKFDDGRV